MKIENIIKILGAMKKSDDIYPNHPVGEFMISNGIDLSIPTTRKYLNKLMEYGFLDKFSTKGSEDRYILRKKLK